jgi:hypothetical protein
MNLDAGESRAGFDSAAPMARAEGRHRVYAYVEASGHVVSANALTWGQRIALPAPDGLLILDFTRYLRQGEALSGVTCYGIGIALEQTPRLCDMGEIEFLYSGAGTAKIGIITSDVRFWRAHVKVAAV